MENPFVAIFQYLQTLPDEKRKSKGGDINLEKTLAKLHSDNNKQIRDRVILLLCHKYRLKPSEIVCLDLEDIKLNEGLIIVDSKRRKVIALGKDDILAFRQWTALRQMYQRTDVVEEAYLISLHWTHGRSLPYCRLSTRAINNVVNTYGRSVGEED